METASLADIVLPAATWGEKTGTFTNADRTVHLSEQAVAPPGEARPDLDIFLDYARRMDFRDRHGAPLIGWHDPESAFEAFVGEGDVVRVESPRGAIEGPARLTDIRRGLVFVPFHSPSCAASSAASSIHTSGAAACSSGARAVFVQVWNCASVRAVVSARGNASPGASWGGR